MGAQREQLAAKFVAENARNGTWPDALLVQSEFPDLFPTWQEAKSFQENVLKSQNAAEVEFHDLANIFPLMEEKDLDGLARDIKKHGLLNPIVLFEGKILDGRNRYLACKKLGIKPKAVVLQTRIDPLEYVLAQNLERRNLTIWQKIELGEKLLPIEKEQARIRQLSKLEHVKDGLSLGEISANEGKALDVVAKRIRISGDTLEHGIYVLHHAPQEELENAKKEDRAVSNFYKALRNWEERQKTKVSVLELENIVGLSDLEYLKRFGYEPCLYNVWGFGNRDERLGIDHVGNIPGQIALNVLYYYTKQGDLVVDPMAGGGSTIDACRVMHRKYLAYDLHKVRSEITQNDIVKDGYPKEALNADLVFLDPPYFNMVFKDLYKDVRAFYSFLKILAEKTFPIVRADGIVALIIEDMTELGKYCLSGESYRIFIEQHFTCIDHVSCPLSTEQFLPQQVEKAKKAKHLLGRNRDLYIFRKEAD